MRRIVIPLLALCLVLALTGCQTLSFASAGDLLRAPALSEEPGAVQKALTAAVGEVEYKYPKEGNNHSPLLLVDLDGDGTEEGVVFYSGGEGNNNVRIAILQKQGDEWQLVDEALGSNTEVASVEVADLYGDGTRLLIVGYANASLGGKTLELYEFNGGALEKPTGLGGYNSYLLGDFTGLGNTDLAIVSRGDGDAGLKLQLVSGREGTVHYVQEGIELLNQFGACVGIYTSVNEDSGKFLVVDALIEASGSIGTQVLAYSETTGQFYVRENDNAAVLNAVNQTVRRQTLLTSRDIDGDGVVETPVPIEYEAALEIEEELAETILFLEWRDYTAEEPQTKHFGLFDGTTGLYVQLPDGWKEGGLQITATDTGWRVRSAGTPRTLLEYRALVPDEEWPDNAMHVQGNTEACLVPSSTLNALELLTIDTVLLV